MSTPPNPAAARSQNRPSGRTRARLDEMAATLPPLARVNRLLSVPEAAAYLALSLRQTWAEVGTARGNPIRGLPSVVVGSRSVRIDPADLRAYIHQRRSRRVP